MNNKRIARELVAVAKSLFDGKTVKVHQLEPEDKFVTPHGVARVMSVEDAPHNKIIVNVYHGRGLRTFYKYSPNSTVELVTGKTSSVHTSKMYPEILPDRRQNSRLWMLIEDVAAEIAEDMSMDDSGVTRRKEMFIKSKARMLAQKYRADAGLIEEYIWEESHNHG